MLHPAFFRGPAARDKAFRRNAQPAPAWSCSGGLGAVHQQAILRSKIAECVPLCIARHLAAPRKAYPSCIRSDGADFRMAANEKVKQDVAA